MNDLYGVRTGGAEAVAKAVADRLGLPFESRDSEYYGAYCMIRTGETKLRVVPQPDPAGELLEPSFPDHPVIVYVDGDTPVEDLAGLTTAGGVLERLR